MKQTLVVVVTLQTLSLGAMAQDVNRSLDASLSGHVAIELVVGDVTVRGWDRAAIQISGELGNGAETVDIDQQGDEITIRVVASDAEGAGTGGAQTELVVSVPRGSSLSVDGTNADLLVAGIEGDLSLETVSGDIEAETFGASIEAHTVGGDVNVASRGAPGDATMTTVAGEIEAAGPFSSITASTVSGDIELDVLDAASMSLTTTNGEIEVHATFDGAAELSAETTNGDVELRVGDADDLNLDIGTFSGRIRTCFDRSPEEAGLDAQTETDGNRVGNGRRGQRGQRGGELIIEADSDSPRVRVRTLNGDIEICSS